MELNHNYDFNEPVEVTEVIRYRDNPNSPSEEFSGRTCFGWEDVMMIKEYYYPDDWKKHAGPKYWVRLRGYKEAILVLGNYDEISRYWTRFRTEYPLYKITDDGLDKD